MFILTIRDTFVTADGGLTAWGYVLFIALGIAAFALAVIISHRRSAKKTNSVKKLVFCAAALALAFIASYIKLFPMPFGGSVTFFSMLFITLIGYWYGPATGLLTAFTYGILQFIQNPYFLSVPQVCLDYLFAFTALGLSGFFCSRKHGLVTGYTVAILARGLFTSLAGYAFWMDYMPDNFPKSIAFLYPVVYNYGYILAEGVLTVIVLLIPAVSRGLEYVKKTAVTSKKG